MGTLHPFPGVSVSAGQSDEADTADPDFIRETRAAFEEMLAEVEAGRVTTLVLLWTSDEGFGATPVKSQKFDVSGMIAATVRFQSALVERCEDP